MLMNKCIRVVGIILLRFVLQYGWDTNPLCGYYASLRIMRHLCCTDIYGTRKMK